MTEPVYKKEHFKKTSWDEAVELMNGLVKDIRGYLQKHDLK
jgi:hypothetical protein